MLYEQYTGFRQNILATRLKLKELSHIFYDFYNNQLYYMPKYSFQFFSSQAKMTLEDVELGFKIPDY